MFKLLAGLLIPAVSFLAQINGMEYPSSKYQSHHQITFRCNLENCSFIGNISDIGSHIELKHKNLTFVNLLKLAYITHNNKKFSIILIEETDANFQDDISVESGNELFYLDQNKMSLWADLEGDETNYLDDCLNTTLTVKISFQCNIENCSFIGSLLDFGTHLELAHHGLVLRDLLKLGCIISNNKTYNIYLFVEQNDVSNEHGLTNEEVISSGSIPQDLNDKQKLKNKRKFYAESAKSLSDFTKSKKKHVIKLVYEYTYDEKLNTEIKSCNTAKEIGIWQCYKTGCHFGYNSTKKYFDHMKGHHNQVKCPKCEKSFSHYFPFSVHIKTHYFNSDLKIFYCNIQDCDKSYSSFNSLVNHLKGHLNKGYYNDERIGTGISLKCDEKLEDFLLYQLD